DVPVLITGESGVGKDVVAREIHARSARASKVFVKINCAALPGELLESELFGHERGSFTGAARTKPGQFELADGGTLFLDEIGEMPVLLQAKLLEALQNGEFYRVGGQRKIRVDVRVLVATNRELENLVRRLMVLRDPSYVMAELRDRGQSGMQGGVPSVMGAAALPQPGMGGMPGGALPSQGGMGSFGPPGYGAGGYGGGP